MRRGLGFAVAGIALGLAAAVALREAIASQLYGVAPLELSVFVMASVILFGVAAIACFVPARRASRVDAVELLRAE